MRLYPKRQITVRRNNQDILNKVKFWKFWKLSMEIIEIVAHGKKESDVEETNVCM